MSPDERLVCVTASMRAVAVGALSVFFGVYLERIPAPVADVFFHTGKATPDVWFLKGSIVETAP